MEFYSDHKGASHTFQIAKRQIQLQPHHGEEDHIQLMYEPLKNAKVF